MHLEREIAKLFIVSLFILTYFTKSLAPTKRVVRALFSYRYEQPITLTGLGKHPLGLSSLILQNGVDPTHFPTLQSEVVTLLNYLTACLHSYLLTEIPG